MVVRKIIPDAYTEYEDGHLGLVAASLANVEAKIGKATGGIPFKVYTLAGPDAKNMAKAILRVALCSAPSRKLLMLDPPVSMQFASVPLTRQASRFQI